MMFKGKKAAVAAAGERRPTNIFFEIFGAIGGVFKFLFVNIGTLAIIIFVVGFLYLLITNYGEMGVQSMGFLGISLNTGIQAFFTNLNCAMGGACPQMGESSDMTQYGILIKDIYAMQTKFLPDDVIEIKALASGKLLSDMDTSGCAKVYCGLQDGTLLSQSSDCIPIRDLSHNVRITCRFEPMVSNSSNVKRASIGLVYDFMTEASLPIAVVDSAEYNSYLDKYLMETDSFEDAERKIARFYHVEMSPASDPKITPVMIAAELESKQPVPKGDDYTNLVVRITNKETGRARIKGISIDLPQGMAIVQTTELDYDVASPIESYNVVKSVFTEETYPSMKEELAPGGSRIYDFTLDTSGFQLEPIDDYATTRKIRIYVDYTYNTTSQKTITITSCREIAEEDKATYDCPLTVMATELV